MSNKKRFSHAVSTAGWGALLIWWGVSLAVEPISLAMCAIGSGLILLSANAARMFMGVPIVHTSTVVGIIALAWGALDQARTLLHLGEGVSFALMFIVIGLVLWVTLLFPHHAEAETN